MSTTTVQNGTNVMNNILQTTTGSHDSIVQNGEGKHSVRHVAQAVLLTQVEQVAAELKLQEEKDSSSIFITPAINADNLTGYVPRYTEDVAQQVLVIQNILSKFSQLVDTYANMASGEQVAVNAKKAVDSSDDDMGSFYMNMRHNLMVGVLSDLLNKILPEMGDSISNMNLQESQFAVQSMQGFAEIAAAGITSAKEAYKEGISAANLQVSAALGAGAIGFLSAALEFGSAAYAAPSSEVAVSKEQNKLSQLEQKVTNFDPNNEVTSGLDGLEKSPLFQKDNTSNLADSSKETQEIKNNIEQKTKSIVDRSVAGLAENPNKVKSIVKEVGTITTRDSDAETAIADSKTYLTPKMDTFKSLRLQNSVQKNVASPGGAAEMMDNNSILHNSTTSVAQSSPAPAATNAFTEIASKSPMSEVDISEIKEHLVNSNNDVVNTVYIKKDASGNAMKAYVLDKAAGGTNAYRILEVDPNTEEVSEVRTGTKVVKTDDGEWLTVEDNKEYRITDVINHNVYEEQTSDPASLIKNGKYLYAVANKTENAQLQQNIKTSYKHASAAIAERDGFNAYNRKVSSQLTDLEKNARLSDRMSERTSRGYHALATSFRTAADITGGVLNAQAKRKEATAGLDQSYSRLSFDVANMLSQLLSTTKGNTANVRYELVRAVADVLAKSYQAMSQAATINK